MFYNTWNVWRYVLLKVNDWKQFYIICFLSLFGSCYEIWKMIYKEKILFQLTTHSHTLAYHLNLWIPSPTSWSELERVLPDKAADRKWSREQYCFMSLFNDWVVEFTSNQSALFTHKHLFVENDDMFSNLVQSNLETIDSDLSILKFVLMCIES